LKEPGTCHGDEDERDFGVKYGVCPALWRILDNWEAILKKASGGADSGADSGDIGDYARWWAEASMGQRLNGLNIKALLHLHGDAALDLENPDLTMARVMESYCDSSAVAALTRLHARKKAQFVDFLALSQKLTSAEKQRLVGLMERYTHYLAMAEADVSSKFMSQASLSGITMQYERYLIHTAGSAGQSAVHLAGRAKSISSLAAFLGDNSVAEAGGAALRVRAPETGLTAREQESLKNFESTRELYDPIGYALRRSGGG
jgi:hypothetical protein